jgi:hypothetical protein
MTGALIFLQELATDRRSLTSSKPSKMSNCDIKDMETSAIDISSERSLFVAKG